MASRTAYVISSANCPPGRLEHVKRLLARIGFSEIYVMTRSPLYRPDRAGLAVLYEIIESVITRKNADYVYVFDDIINTLVELKLDELTEYERLANGFFYLGIDKINQNKGIGYTGKTIGSRNVYSVKGNVSSAHAFALSLQGAHGLMAQLSTNRYKTVDLCLCAYSKTHAVPVVRYDLQGVFNGQRGAIFADLCQFNTEFRPMF